YGMVGLERSTKKGAVKEVGQNKGLKCHFYTPIPVGKRHRYPVTGTISFPNPTSTRRCADAKTGQQLWKKGRVGKDPDDLLRTGDGKLLMLSGLGHLVLIDPSPKEYRELARTKVGKGEQIWAHPALADGKLYLRDEKELICLELPE